MFKWTSPFCVTLSNSWGISLVKKRENKITINYNQHCKIILIKMMAAITKNAGVIMIMTPVKTSTKTDTYLCNSWKQCKKQKTKRQMRKQINYCLIRWRWWWWWSTDVDNNKWWQCQRKQRPKTVYMAMRAAMAKVLMIRTPSKWRQQYHKG